MNEEIFLSKYPELNENGFISDLKITLLKSYLNSDISKEDNKIKIETFKKIFYLLDNDYDDIITGTNIFKGIKNLPNELQNLG